MRKRKLKLYVWTGFCPDYTDGLAFAIAESEEKARKLVEPDADRRAFITWGTLEVFGLNEPRAFAVWGGG